MSDNTKTVDVLTWQRKDGTGEKFAVEVESLPQTSRMFLMQRGLTHILGNEAAAKEMTEAEKDEWRHEKIKALVDGTVSIREVGPRMPSDERIRREYSQAVIIALSKKEGWEGVAKRIGGFASELKAMPKASDKDAWTKLHEAFMAKPALARAAEAEVAKRAEVALPEFEEAVA